MSNPFGPFVILLAQLPDSVANPIQRSQTQLTKSARTLSSSTFTGGSAKLLVPTEGFESSAIQQGPRYERDTYEDGE